MLSKIIRPDPLTLSINKIGVVKLNLSKKEIGLELSSQLKKGYDIERIANWADELFFNLRDNRSLEIEHILRNIFMMDAGPEFEYTKEELELIAEMLIRDEMDPIAKIEIKRSEKG